MKDEQKVTKSRQKKFGSKKVCSNGIRIDSLWNSSECTYELGSKYWFKLAEIGSKTDFEMVRIRGEQNLILNLHQGSQNMT